MAGDERRPVRAERVVWVDVDGEVVAWDPLRQVVHHLDALTSAIWMVLDGAASVPDLVADVVAVSGSPMEEAGRLVGTVIGLLDERDLLAS